MAEPDSAEPTSGVEETRAAWGTLSRDGVIDAATRIVAAGQEELTIRGLAAHLGVSPMALYRHVEDKDELVHEVVDRLLRECWQPTTAEDDWRAWVIEAADRLRTFLVETPPALHIYLHRPFVSPAALVRMEAALDVMLRALGDRAAADRLYAAVHTYTLGFAAVEAARRQEPEGAPMDDLGRVLTAYTEPGQFVSGLHLLLDGAERPRVSDSGPAGADAATAEDA